MVVAELRRLRILSRVDRPSLRCYVEAVALHEQASRMLAETGLLIRDKDGDVRKSPLLQVQRDAAQTIRAFAQEFGLTPAARQALRSVDDHEEMPPELRALFA